VLLPVILEVITEATDALGGQIFSGAEEVAWIGEVGGSRKPLSLELDATTRLLLFPPDNGFSRDTRTLAEWLASQAAVALENARLHDIVQRQAITDDLTGLVNRRRFIEALDAEIERARRFDSPLAIVLADLDNFKQVNDEFGHHGGDLVLRGVCRPDPAPRPRRRRLGDGSGRGVRDPAARDRQCGGRSRRGADASLPERRLDPAVRRRHDSRASSFGVAELAPDQEGEDLLRAADSALYRAKDEGKNRVVA
jgi:GGDEF domain-containing protein